MSRHLARRTAIVGLALLAAAPSLGAARQGAEALVPMSAEELIRSVARAQRRADLAVAASTFEQVEVKTDFGRDGRPKAIHRRRFRYTAGDGSAVRRELLEVDGRPPTEAEIAEVAEEDAKEHRRRVDRRAAHRASRPPEVGGSEEDPLLGPIRLSDLISRFSYGPVEEVLVDGRPAYGLDFAPRPGRVATRTLDRALGSLAGRVLVDATDLQVVSVDARLVTPLRVGGGLAASIRSASIAYRAQRLADGAWLPCLVGIRLQGRTGVLFRLDSAYRFEFSDYARFLVDVETEVGRPGGPSVQSAP
ncbi:MAG TPA: hypothetical protein P5164_08225 [Thermoanaerobaculia bacterium]|nr:hypothetical protein [Thermoanaerobaculia bacterium]